MPRLTTLVVAIAIWIAVPVAVPVAAAATASAAGSASPPPAVAVGASVPSPEADPRQTGSAVAPPGTGDVDRVHSDPGAWPGLVFILGLFVFGVVVRGSRPRNRGRGLRDGIRR